MRAGRPRRPSRSRQRCRRGPLAVTRSTARETDRADTADQQRDAERQAEQHDRHGARTAPECECEAALTVADEQRHHRRRVVDRVDADAENDAGAEQQRSESAVLPSAEHEPDDAGGHDHVADQDRAAGDEVVDRCRRRRSVGVAHVEQPVSEAAGDLGRCRGERHRLERLRIGQHVGAVAALDHQHHDPPERHAEAQHTGLGSRHGRVDAR